MFEKLEKTIVVTGHYGSGKTNFAVNLALALAKKDKVTVVDLDIVNPYFRTADFKQLFEQNGVDAVVPEYANSNLDVPALGPRIGASFGKEGYLIIDVGGDDAGAVALGRYSAQIESAGGYSMLYVVNFCRLMTDTAAKAGEYIGEIEAASRLRISCIVNNSNLSLETTRETVLAKAAQAEELRGASGLSLLCHCAPDFLGMSEKELSPLFNVKRYVKTNWEEDR